MQARTPLARAAGGVLAALLTLGLLAGCGSGAEEVPAAAPPTTQAPGPTVAETTTSTFTGLDPDRHYAVYSKVEGEHEVFAEPSEDAEITHRFPNPWLGTSTLVFLVDEMVSPDWYKVFLPTRPNGSTGFVRAADVDRYEMTYRLEVHLSDFRLVLYENDQVVMDTTVAVAAENTPTPGGLYYITELRGPFPETNAYGTYAYGLSGYSEVHQTFEGGPGQLGIHGTNKPELIGQAVSNGCIRMRNEDVNRLVHEFQLPLGVPVDVIA